ncbi:MAG: sugar-binding transcriptional regulator [Candidatus Nanopelagicales bacterium]
MADDAALRLVTKAARLYHTHGLRQTEIAARLGISQSKVSRLLQQAEESRIVRTVVATPLHLHPELEEAVEEKFGLAEVHVVEAVDDADDSELLRDLASAAAALLGDLSQDAPTVAWSSWSRTLRATVDAMMPLRLGTKHVVEMVGDLGPPHLQHEAARSTQQLASLLGAEPVFLRTPGVVPTAEVARLIVGQDGYAHDALDLLDDLDLALISVGALDPSSPLEPGRGFFSKQQIAEVRKAGAVGEVCMRYVDADGNAVESSLDDLTIGVTLDQLARARRRWAVVGGRSKHAAIRAALAGGYVDVLVTDVATARQLTDDSSGRRKR